MCTFCAFAFFVTIHFLITECHEFFFCITLALWPNIHKVKHSEEYCCVCDVFHDHILRNLHYKKWKLLFSVSDKTLIYCIYNYSKFTTLTCNNYCERQTDIWTLSADTWLGLTYFSILESFVCCNITNFITVLQRSVCLCVFFLFFQCNTTVIYAKLEDTATFYICNWQCFKLSVFFRSLYSEREHVLKLRQHWLWCGCCSAFCTKG